MSKIQRIPTAKLTYEEWVELRKSLVYKGMVGGSDASTLLGLNPWTSKITRWNQSVGTANIKNIDNEIMFHGRLLEDYVADLWQYWTGDPMEMINNYQSKTKLRKFIFSVGIGIIVFQVKYLITGHDFNPPLMGAFVGAGLAGMFAARRKIKKISKKNKRRKKIRRAS